MDEEEDAICHLLRDHRDTLRRLPRTCIVQARDKPLAPIESCHNPMLLPAGTQDEEEDEEEAPPPPPPILSPLLQGGYEKEEAKKAPTELWDQYTDSLHGHPFVDTDLTEN